MTRRELTAVEARVLGVLVEKQATVPDTYPLSLNALVVGLQPEDRARSGDERQRCRGAAGARLRCAPPTWWSKSSGSRVSRYEHNLPRAWALPGGLGGAARGADAARRRRPPPSCAPTAERLHRFADIVVGRGLSRRAGRPRIAAAACVKLPRAPGAREARWAHLLCGEPALDVSVVPEPLKDDVLTAAEQLAAIKAEQAAVAGADGRAAGDRGAALSRPWRTRKEG